MPGPPPPAAAIALAPGIAGNPTEETAGIVALTDAQLLDAIAPAIALATETEPVAPDLPFLVTIGGYRVLAVSNGILPDFTTDPQTQTVDEFESVMLSWAATNADTFQLMRQAKGIGSWVSVSGATTSPYTSGELTVSANDGDKYRVDAVGPGGPASSAEATITVEAVIPTITTRLFDENFSVNKAATFTGNVGEATSTGIGTRKWWNAKAGDNISGGVLNFDSATILIMADGATNRARSVGRMHYLAFRAPAGPDFQSVHLGLAQSDNATGNVWFLGANAVNTGIYTNDSPLGSIRDLRDYQTSPHSNYIHKQVIPQSGEVEFAIYERGATGVALFYRIDAGNWRLGWVENLSDRSGIVVLRNDGSGAGTIARRVTTADTTMTIRPIVQHSFAAALSPSDGAGQLETGGSGVVAETAGSVAIVSNRLAMSADGYGKVVWEVGTTDWIANFKCRVHNGSPVGAVVRWVDTNNYLYVEVDSTNDRLRLYEVVAGSQTTLVTANFNPGSTDTLNLADAADIQLTVKNFGDTIIAILYPGSLHDAMIQTTTTRFNTATKCGALVSKGSGVNSSTIHDFVVFSGVQTLPDFSA